MKSKKNLRNKKQKKTKKRGGETPNEFFLNFKKKIDNLLSVKKFKKTVFYNKFLIEKHRTLYEKVFKEFENKLVLVGLKFKNVFWIQFNNFFDYFLKDIEGKEMLVCSCKTYSELVGNEILKYGLISDEIPFNKLKNNYAKLFEFSFAFIIKEIYSWINTPFPQNIITYRNTLSPYFEFTNITTVAKAKNLTDRTIDDPNLSAMFDEEYDDKFETFSNQDRKTLHINIYKYLNDLSFYVSLENETQKEMTNKIKLFIETNFYIRFNKDFKKINNNTLESAFVKIKNEVKKAKDISELEKLNESKNREWTYIISEISKIYSRVPPDAEKLIHELQQ